MNCRGDLEADDDVPGSVMMVVGVETMHVPRSAAARQVLAD